MPITVRPENADPWRDVNASRVSHDAGAIREHRVFCSKLVNGVSDGRRLMPDDDRDLCEICWSPLQTLMKKVQAEALEAKRTS